MPTLAFSPLRRSALRPLAGCGIVVALAMPAAAQQQPAEPASSEPPRPLAEWSNSVHSFRDSLVTMARAQVGTKYVRGGQSPARGFDCSGLVRYVMAGLKVPLPRTASQQARLGLAVQRDTSRLRPGDLLTFGNGKRGVSHIGIYVGNGRYVHASSVAGRVIESDLQRPRTPLIRPWRGVRRVVADQPELTERGDS
jgi:cell wall-associated NlpC family hydrolase